MSYFRYAQAHRTNSLLSRILRRMDNPIPTSARLAVTTPTGTDNIVLEIGAAYECEMTTTLPNGDTVTTSFKISCLDIN